MKTYDIEDIAASTMMKRLLKERLDTGYKAITYSEIELICCMFGINKEDNDD